MASTKGKRVKASEAPATITTYKGFDLDLTCRGFAYEIGKTYTHDGSVVRCTSQGFHSCEMPLDVWNYYRPCTSRFAEVAIGGQIDRADGQDTKVASGSITIKAELKLLDLIKVSVKWVLDRAKANTARDVKECAAATGNSGHAAATGDSGHAAATGNYGHAAATGDSGHAAATGNYGHAAATGNSGIAFAGFNGRAKAGANGAFAIAWFDDKATRARLIVGTPGENGIKADTFYCVKDGALVEAQS